MRTLSTLSLIALPLLLAGCFDIPMGKPGDTAGDTAGGDTASDDTASDDTSDSGDDTASETGTAYVRFVDLAAGASVVFQVDAVTSETLFQTQGTVYEAVSAGTPYIAATNSGEPLAEITDYTLAADGHYSIAFTPAGELLISEDDLSTIDGTDTRMSLINASGETVRWNVGYWDGDSFNGPGKQTLEDGGVATALYTFPTAAVQLELTTADLDGLNVDWNASAFLQVAPATLVDVYFWNEGDCSLLSTSCAPMILGHFADGSTATVELISAFGWAG